MTVVRSARWCHQICPVVATRGWISAQGLHLLSGEGLGESDAVAAGLAQVGVVEEPVDGGGGQGLGHELVESGGVQIRGDRHAAAFVGGVDEAVEPFGGVGSPPGAVRCRRLTPMSEFPRFIPTPRLSRSVVEVCPSKRVKVDYVGAWALAWSG